METVKLKINGIEVEAPKNATILEAAHLAGIEIPTLCYLKNINAIGACRICVVEVKGARAMAAACVYPAVSYTHLNVYKRQSWPFPGLSFKQVKKCTCFAFSMNFPAHWRFPTMSKAGSSFLLDTKTPGGSR